MKVLLQRVQSASVQVDGQIIGKIGPGLLLFLGVGKTDTAKQAHFLAEKVANLRIFTDSNEKMNCSLKELNLEALVISQFTLYANCTSGRRPDFLEAAPPQVAEPLYLEFINALEKQIGSSCERGVFGAKMSVHLVNDGPVTLMIEN